MEFDAFTAIRLTPIYAQLTRWTECMGKVFAVLGFRTRNPTPLEFVMAVRSWQRDRPPLIADGLLGAATWKALHPAVRAYHGGVAIGPRPEWVDSGAKESDNDMSPTPSAPAPAAVSAEDRALQSLVNLWSESDAMTKAVRDLAIPVGHECAADPLRPRVPELRTAGICGTLRIGQVWAGVAGGDRTIVALIAAARCFAGAIIFQTESGQPYYQSASSWNADFLAGLYAGTVTSLSPRQMLLETEVQLLLAEPCGRANC